MCALAFDLAVFLFLKLLKVYHREKSAKTWRHCKWHARTSKTPQTSCPRLVSLIYPRDWRITAGIKWREGLWGMGGGGCLSQGIQTYYRWQLVSAGRLRWRNERPRETALKECSGKKSARSESGGKEVIRLTSERREAMLLGWKKKCKSNWHLSDSCSFLSIWSSNLYGGGGCNWIN